MYHSGPLNTPWKDHSQGQVPVSHVLLLLHGNRRKPQESLRSPRASWSLCTGRGSRSSALGGSPEGGAKNGRGLSQCSHRPFSHRRKKRSVRRQLKRTLQVLLWSLVGTMATFVHTSDESSRHEYTASNCMFQRLKTSSKFRVLCPTSASLGDSQHKAITFWWHTLGHHCNKLNHNSFVIEPQVKQNGQGNILFCSWLTAPSYYP